MFRDLFRFCVSCSPSLHSHIDKVQVNGWAWARAKQETYSSDSMCVADKMYSENACSAPLLCIHIQFLDAECFVLFCLVNFRLTFLYSILDIPWCVCVCVSACHFFSGAQYVWQSTYCAVIQLYDLVTNFGRSGIKGNVLIIIIIALSLVIGAKDTYTPENLLKWKRNH